MRPILVTVVKRQDTSGIHTSTVYAGMNAEEAKRSGTDPEYKIPGTTSLVEIWLDGYLLAEVTPYELAPYLNRLEKECSE